MDFLYAEVYPDTRVLDFNRHFDYKIPQHLAGRIKTGNIVTVPLKNRLETGYVSRLKGYSSIKDRDLKFIKDVSGDISVFDNQRLKLLYWMCAYYIQPFGKIAELFLPPVDKGRIKNILNNPEKSMLQCTLLELNKEMLNDFEEKSGRQKLLKQKVIVDYLKSCGQAEKKHMFDTINPSSSSLKSLIKTGIVIEKKVRRKNTADNNGSFSLKTPDNINKNQILSDNENLNTISFLNSSGEPQNFDLFLYGLNNEISSGIFKAYLIKGLSFEEKAYTAEMIINCAAGSLKKTLFLVPESADALKFWGFLKDGIKNQICVYHSEKNMSTRFEDWYDIYKNRYSAIIGTRSSVFLPVKNAGAIILFEEQNSSYKDSSIVRYNTTDVVLKLAKILKIPVVFFSDAPSVGTMHLFSSSTNFFVMDKKTGINSKNRIIKEIIDLKKIDCFKDDYIITKKLHKYIIDTSSKKENILIFANRRGYSSFVTCKKCGNTPRCPNCDISYSFHNDKKTLVCHHCYKKEVFNGVCSKCGGRDFLYKANGIENVEFKLKKRFPDIPLIRIDSDIMGSKEFKKLNSSEKQLSSPFILLGTRKMLSSLKSDNISLAAVTDFDSLLQLPDFHVNERAFQVMDKITSFLKKDGKSQFIIQAYNTENTALKNFINKDFNEFYKEELKNREELGYPPFSNLINIIVSGKDEKTVIPDIESIYNKLNALEMPDLKILGPSPAPYYKINLNYRWHMLLKTNDLMRLCVLLSKIMKNFNKNDKNKIITDVDPAWIL